MSDTEKMVEQEKIKTQLYLYCKWMDACDWDALRTLFAEEHIHHHGSFTGYLEEFIGFARKTMDKVEASQHSLSNILVDISEDGLSATSESNFYAVHFVKSAHAANMHFDAPAEDTDWLVAGIYKDRWVKRDGKWLIIERIGRHVWDRVEPAKPPSSSSR